MPSLLGTGPGMHYNNSCLQQNVYTSKNFVSLYMLADKFYNKIKKCTMFTM